MAQAFPEDRWSWSRGASIHHLAPRSANVDGLRAIFPEVDYQVRILLEFVRMVVVNE